MTTGIIYIAQNKEANLPNEYKIGKSDKADPSHRMRELTSETTNYKGEYKCLGYALVKDVDQSEILVHDYLSKFRINNKREFFCGDLNFIVEAILKVLKDRIIINYFSKDEKKAEKKLNDEFKQIFDDFHGKLIKKPNIK
jgi:hypothetical protein